MSSEKNTEPATAGVRMFLARRLAIVAAVGLAAFAMAIVAGGDDDGQPATSMPPAEAQELGADAAHQPPAYTRTLAVHAGKESAPSADPARMRGTLLDGKLPDGVVEATVLTDEDCEPDAKGVSHCRNQLRLPSGKTVTVRHPHRMHDVPCMVPGERVRVGRALHA
jgi:hypothetical protein